MVIRFNEEFRIYLPSRMNMVNTVLLVDDDKITNFLNERLIRRTEFANEVIIKLNGKEALSYLTEECTDLSHYPTLILLDINMPVINGIEFIELLKEIHNPILENIKICILSTSENIHDIEKLKSLGTYYFVSKPLTREKLNQIFEINFKDQVA